MTDVTAAVTLRELAYRNPLSVKRDTFLCSNLVESVQSIQNVELID